MKIYGYAVIDGHRQKIGNFRIEPPGLFRGRGGHPKMGRLKKRVRPEDVIINCSKYCFAVVLFLALAKHLRYHMSALSVARLV